MKNVEYLISDYHHRRKLYNIIRSMYSFNPVFGVNSDVENKCSWLIGTFKRWSDTQ